MFRTAPDIESAPEVVPCDHPVPLSELALTIPVPTEGWPAFLAARDVDVKTDDIGRPSVTPRGREDAYQHVSRGRGEEGFAAAGPGAAGNRG
jgi:hypothetical protein